MYGFVEKWLADILNIRGEIFTLNDGCEALIIGQEQFSRLSETITNMWTEEDGRSRYHPQVINADVVGMKVLLHKYINEDGYIDGLTSAEAKTSTLYIAIKSMELPRFNSTVFQERIVALHGGAPILPAAQGTVVDSNVNTEPGEIQPVTDEEVGNVFNEDLDNVGFAGEADFEEYVQTQAPPETNGSEEPETNEEAETEGSPDNVIMRLTKDNLPSEMLDADGSFPSQNGGGDVRITADEMVDAGPTPETITVDGEPEERILPELNPNSDDHLETVISGNTVTLRPRSTPTSPPIMGRNIGESETPPDLTEAVRAENAKNDSPMDDVMDEIIPEQPEVEEIPQTPEERFLEFLSTERFMMSCNKSETPIKKKRVFLVGRGNQPTLLDIHEMAEELEKNIIVFTDPASRISLSNIKSYFKLSDIEKHSLLLFIDPSATIGFTSPPATEDNISVCMGEEVHKLFFVKGIGRESQKTAIRNDVSLTDEEKELRISGIDSKPDLSAYSKYDKIFKDSHTNVVWALKDRCIIHFMWRLCTPSNRPFSKKVFTEMSRRYGNKLSRKELLEIDWKFHKEISEREMENYVNFSVESSKTIINELKQNQENEYKKYKDFFNKAMEHGKLAGRYSEQIEAFNESDFVSKEKKKSLDAYEETRKIPGVLSINVKDETIHVYTKNLYAQDERTDHWHDVGTFHITIGMTSNKYDTSHTVKILNTKHQFKGMNDSMQAPHVFTDGHICHGSLATGMVEAYTRRDLFQLVYQIMLFLQDANTDDAAGKYIDKWPKVPTEFALNALKFEDEKEEEVEEAPNEAESKFDDLLAEAIPVKI
jgi:hypothetical protein